VVLRRCGFFYPFSAMPSSDGSRMASLPEL
jgi:hypothetical protein